MGLRSETIYLSPNANIYSLTDTFSTAQRDRIRHNMESSYTLFKDRVLAGRKNLTADSLEVLAQGKIHLGYSAKQNGIVDGLMGIARVQRKMAKKLDIEDEYAVKHYSQFSTFDIFEFLEKLAIVPEGFFTNSKSLPISLKDENLWYIAPYILELE